MDSPFGSPRQFSAYGQAQFSAGSFYADGGVSGEWLSSSIRRSSLFEMCQRLRRIVLSTPLLVTRFAEAAQKRLLRSVRFQCDVPLTLTPFLVKIGGQRGICPLNSRRILKAGRREYHPLKKPEVLP
ncbi:MAG: hypothetical protein U0452_15555 [Anaerolineae bacterium]